jgi:hypothetical protein
MELGQSARARAELLNDLGDRDGGVDLNGGCCLE